MKDMVSFFHSLLYSIVYSPSLSFKTLPIFRVFIFCFLSSSLFIKKCIILCVRINYILAYERKYSIFFFINQVYFLNIKLFSSFHFFLKLFKKFYCTRVLHFFMHLFVDFHLNCFCILDIVILQQVFIVFIVTGF